MKRTLVGSRTPEGDPRTSGCSELRVWIDGKRLDPRASQRVWNHSPDGFNAGYGGSGPAQLALAILLECGFEQEHAVALHQPFKWEFIAKKELAERDFSFEFDAEEWAAKRETEPHFEKKA